jgi:DNA polymerase-3 subunit delta
MTAPFEPIHCLGGDEPYRRDQFLLRLRGEVLGPGGEDFNYLAFEGAGCHPSSIVDEANCLPMMADARLVRVNGAENLDGKALKILATYAQSPNPSTCLVLVFQGSMDKARKAFQGCRVSFREFLRPRPWEVVAQVQELARETGLRLKPGAAQALAELIGDDLQKIVGELEKLSLYKGGAEVNADDVSALMGRTRLVTRWELQALIGTRDLAGALAKCQDILAGGEEPIALLSAIVQYLRQLFRVKALMKTGVSEKGAMASALRLPPKIAGDLMAQQASYSEVELRECFHKAQQCDLRLKSSRLQRGLLVDQFLASMIAQGPFSPPKRTLGRR